MTTSGEGWWGEVEFSGDEKKDGARGFEASVAPGFAFCGLEKAVEGFDEAIGLAGPCPGDDAVEVVSDHAGDVLHGLDFGAHHIDAPLPEHGGDDVDRPALKDLAQVLAVEPGSGGALGGGLGDEGGEIGAALAGSRSKGTHTKPRFVGLKLGRLGNIVARSADDTPIHAPRVAPN